ncbi:hypothetical protein [Nocardioides sp. T2.26MG-1]|uniref:hypothetical protein n=1 Tax=Nocardioides sp. T2.26MG-1 TaxID=3041166 RepID=UPI002477B2DC|nr:hypothetical protein [Nocardioides sp. T2.26MG-1]CAI9412531.1 hypothetical protein HIDPHFAB_01795 [Nocardioides sp. T2.26MG-1]
MTVRTLRLLTSRRDRISLRFASDGDAATATERALHLPGALVDLTGRDLTILVPDGRDLVTSYVTDLAWAGVLAERLEVVEA